MDRPKELEIYLRRMGWRVTRNELISTRETSSGRLTLKVILDDGTAIKARWLLDEDHASAWYKLRMSVGDQPYLSCCLHREGRMAIEEWVEGRCILNSNHHVEILERAAETLAMFHSVEIAARRPMAPSSEFDLAKSRIQSLVHHKAITSSVAMSLEDLLRASPPAQTFCGLAHHDFCGDNLVLHPSRGVVSIDHEWMCVGSLEFDLGRAIYRWGLQGADMHLFVTSYKRAGGPASADSLPWWIFANEIFAAEIRIRRNWSDASAAVELLHRRLGGR